MDINSRIIEQERQDLANVYGKTKEAIDQKIAAIEDILYKKSDLVNAKGELSDLKQAKKEKEESIKGYSKKSRSATYRSTQKYIEVLDNLIDDQVEKINTIKEIKDLDSKGTVELNNDLAKLNQKAAYLKSKKEEADRLLNDLSKNVASGEDTSKVAAAYAQASEIFKQIKYLSSEQGRRTKRPIKPAKPILPKAINQEAFKEMRKMASELKNEGKRPWGRVSAYDTETTGLTKDDVAVTLGLASSGPKGGNKKSWDYILDYGDDKVTKQYLAKAANLLEQSEESALGIRKLLGINHKEKVTADDINLDKVRDKLIDAQKFADWLDKHPETLIGFNTDFDNPKLAEWLKVYSVSQEKAVNKIKSRLSGAVDYMSKIHATTPNVGKNRGRLQDYVKYLFGNSNTRAHEAGSDALDTIAVAEKFETTKAFEGLNEYAKGRKINNLNQGKFFDEVAGVLDNNKTYKNSTENIDELISSMNSGRASSMTGNELVNRYLKYTGKNLSEMGLAGIGENDIGTTRGALRRLQESANANGYQMILRKESDSQIGIALIPDAEYDPSNINYDNQKLKFSIQIADEKGLFSDGKINRAAFSTIWTEEDGDFVANPRFITSETKQIENVINTLNGSKWSSRTEEENAIALRSAVSRAMELSLPSQGRGLSSGEIQDLKEDYGYDYTHDLSNSEIFGIRSTSASYNEYIDSVLNNADVKKAIDNFRRARDGNKFKPVDGYNPDRELRLAIIDAFNIAANGINQNKLAATDKNSLLRFLLEDESLGFFRRDAANVGKLGIDYTSMSEGRYGLGAINFASSKQYAPFGWLYDWTQRSLTQGYDQMRLTPTAALARESAAGSVSRPQTLMSEVASELFDQSDAYHRTYALAALTQNEFAKYQEEYYRELGKSEEEIKNLLVDLEDKIVLNPSLKSEMQGVQPLSSRAVGTLFELEQILTQGQMRDVMNNKHEVGFQFDPVKLEKDIDFGGTKFSAGVTATLKRVSDGWVLVSEQIKDMAQGSKFILPELGMRTTLTGDEGFSSWLTAKLSDKYGTAVSGAVLKHGEYSERNFAQLLNGKLAYIVSQAIEEGLKPEEIYQKIQQINPLLASITKATDKGIATTVRGYDEAKNQLYTLSSSGDKLYPFEGKKDELANLLVNGLNEIGAALIKNYDAESGLIRSGIGQHNVYSYEDLTGYANADELERIGRVRDDFKVKDARKRNLEFYGQAIVQSQSDESIKQQLQSGINQIKDFQNKQDNTFGKNALEAQKARADISKAWQVLNGERYVTPEGAKDIEFVAGIEKLAENQIDINKVITDLKEQTEDGVVSEEDLENYAMEVARKLQEELVKKDSSYKNGSIILNAVNSAIGGKKFLLAGIKPSRNPEGKYHVSNIDRASSLLLKAFATGDKDEFDKAALYAQNVYHNIANDKNSALYDASTHSYVPYSGFNVASSSTLSKILSDGSLNRSASELNTVQMSSKRLRESLATASTASRDDVKANVETLLSEYKVKSKAEWDALNEEDKKLFDRIEDKSRNELKVLEEKIIQYIINSIKNKNNNYTTRIGRYPYTEGYEGNLSRIGINDTLGDQIQMSQGMLASLRGDTDGDKLRMAHFFMNKYNGDTFVAEQAYLKFYDQYAENLERILISQAGNKKEDPVGSIAKLAQNIAEGKDINSQAALEAKQSFQRVGEFSNAATNVRTSMDTLGYGKQLFDERGKEQAFYADTFKALLETFEQDAISSKKIYSRLQKSKSETESYQIVEQLSSLLSQGKVNEYLKLAEEMGVLQMLTSGAQFNNMRARWGAIDPAFLAKMGNKFGITNLADLNSTQEVGFTNSLLNTAIGDFSRTIEQRSQGRATLADAMRYSRAIDAASTVSGTSREQSTYYKTEGETSRGGKGGPGGPGGPGVSGSSISLENGIVNIYNPSEVDIIEATDINIVGENVNLIGAMASGNTSSGNQASVKPIYNLKNESGQYIWSHVVGAEIDPNAIHVTATQSSYHKPQSPFQEDIGNRSSVSGTFAHAMTEGMIKEGKNSVEELARDFVDAAEAETRKSYASGGIGMDMTEGDLAKLKKRAEVTTMVANKIMGLGGDLAGFTEDSNYFKIGSQQFQGTTDYYGFTRDSSGKLQAHVYDWKFSQHGGQDEPGQLALRYAQESTYAHAEALKYENLLNSFDSLDKNEIKKEFKLSGKDDAELKSEIQERIEALKSATIATLRNFITKSGETMVEVSSGKVLDRNLASMIMENGLNGDPLLLKEIFDKVGQSFGYYDAEGNAVEMPQEIADNISADRGELTAKRIKDEYKEILELQEKIAELKFRENTLSGKELENNTELIKIYESMLSSKQGKLGLSSDNTNINGAILSGNLQQELNLLKLLSERKILGMTPKEKPLRTQGVTSQINRRINNFLDYQLFNQIFMRLRKSFSQLIQTAQQLDKELVNIQIATGYTYDQTKLLMQEYSNLAYQIGRTTKEVAAAANDWLRAGYQGKEATELVTASMYLSTLGMMSSENATKALISVLKGWKLASDEVISVVDKLVTVDMQAAVSAGDIATAMSKVNYSAQAAGVEMNTLIGILTAGQETSQQAPEMVGNAWRTIFARVQNVKAGKYSASYSEMQSSDYNEEDWTALNDVETVLKTVGIQLRSTSTSYKSTEQVLNEIASQWNTFDDVTRSAIANAMAGTRQREQFMVAMNNWDAVLNYASIAADSYGTATEKMEAYTESIEAAKNRITAAWEALSLEGNLKEIMVMLYNTVASFIENFEVLLIPLLPILVARIISISGGMLKQDTILGNLSIRLANLGQAVTNLTNKTNQASSTIAANGATNGVVNTKAALGGLGVMLGGVGGTLLGNMLGNQSALGTVIGGTIGSVLPVILGSSGPFAPLIVGGIMAIGGIIASIIKTNQEKQLKEIKNAAKLAEESYDSRRNALSKLNQYIELSSGVDKYGNNISLSDSDYTKFLEVSNSLADAFPNMVKYVDDAGNKFLDLTMSTEECAEALDGLTYQALEDKAKKETEPDIIKDAIKEIDWPSVSEELALQARYLSVYEARELQPEEDRGSAIYAEAEYYDPKLYSKLYGEYLEEMRRAAQPLLKYAKDYAILSMGAEKYYGLSENMSTALSTILSNTLEKPDLDGGNLKNTAEIVSDYFTKITEAGIEDLMSQELNDSMLVGEWSGIRDQLLTTLVQSLGDINNPIAQAFLEFFGFGVENGSVFDSQDYLNGLKDLKVYNSELAGRSASDVKKFYQWVSSGKVSATENIDTILSMLDADANLSGSKDVQKEILNRRKELANELPKELSKVLLNNANDLTAINVNEIFKDYNANVRERISNLIKDFADKIIIGEDGEVSTEVQSVINAITTIALNSLTKDFESVSIQGLKEAFNYDNLGIEGTIDDFSELKKVLDTVASSYNTLAKAQEEQALTGQLSTKTLIDLLDENENYVKALEITEDGVKLASNATEIMAQVQLEETHARAEEILVTKDHNVSLKENELKTLENSEANVDSALKRIESLEAIEAETHELYKNTVQTLENAAAKARAEGNWSVAMGYDIELAEFKSNYYDEQEVAVLQAKLKEIQDNIVTAKEELADAEKMRDIWKDIVDRINTEGVTDYGEFLRESGYEIDVLTKLLEILEAQLSSINKEFEAMEAKDNNRFTTYFSQKAAILRAEIEEYNNLLTKVSNGSKEYYEYLGKQEQAKVDLANLDDELIQDQVSILNNLKGSVNALAEQYNVLQSTADTDAERIEYAKQYKDQLMEQLKLIQSAHQFQKEMMDFHMEYLSGDTNTSTYRVLINNMNQNLQIQLEEAQKIMNTVSERIAVEFEQAQFEITDGMGNRLFKTRDEVKQWLQTEEGQKTLNGELLGNEEYQSAVKDYLEAFQEIGNLIIQDFEWQIAQIQRQIDQLDISKPDSWGSINDINKYYNTLIGEAKNIKEYVKGIGKEGKIQIEDLEDATSGFYYEQLRKIESVLDNADKLTDEQIEDYVAKYNEMLKKIYAAEIARREAIKTYQESQYNAVTYYANSYIKQLEKQKEIISDNYDKELRKLQDKQKSIERTNKLIELQNNLLKAQQEKQRVYRTGIGWVYESNRPAIKEAQQQLNDFYLQDSITDLENAKNREMELLDNRIATWNNYLAMLQTKYEEYERLNNFKLAQEILGVESEEELMDLLLNDALKFNEDYSLQQDAFLRNQINAYESYTSVMDSFLSDYKLNVENLEELKARWIQAMDVSDYINRNDINVAQQEAENIYRTPVGNENYKYPDDDDWLNVDFSLLMQEALNNGGVYRGSIGRYYGYTYDQLMAEREKKIAKYNMGQDSASTGREGDQYGYIITTEELDKGLKSGTLGVDENNAMVYDKVDNVYIDANGKTDITVPKSTGKSYGGSDVSYVEDLGMSQSQIDNQYKYLESLIAQGGGVAAWASAQMDALYNNGYYQTIPGVAGYASGIDKGPVTYTGLAMLHGSKTSPEYVLNSDQAYSILRYMANNRPDYTTTGSDGGTQYVVQGDIVLEGVNDPARFWDEVTTAMNSRWSVTKNR